MVRVFSGPILRLCILLAIICAQAAACTRFGMRLEKDSREDVSEGSDLFEDADDPVEDPLADSEIQIDPVEDSYFDVVDTSMDTVSDTAHDSTIDTAVDTGFDTGHDPGVDTDIDFGVDTVVDSLVDPAADPTLDTETDPGPGWGTPVCGSDSTIADMGSYSDSVSLPDLGSIMVMELYIVIDDRNFMGTEIPFDDLVVSLTSPGGTEHVFWSNFRSDDTGGYMPDYGFPATWLLPQWWGTSVVGTWTIHIEDNELTLTSTTLTEWCLTPLDPSPYASVNTGASLNACATDTGSIPDCDLSVPECPREAIFEMQVDDIILDAGIPVLDLDIAHSRTQDLRIVITLPNGTKQTLWDRTTGTIPGSFSLTGLSGDWLTGRYQIRAEDHDELSTGSVTSWCVKAN